MRVSEVATRAKWFTPETLTDVFTDSVFRDVPSAVEALQRDRLPRYYSKFGFRRLFGLGGNAVLVRTPDHSFDPCSFLGLRHFRKLAIYHPSNARGRTCEPKLEK
jgi:hypothetical protein